MRPGDEHTWIAQAASILGMGLRYHTIGQAVGPCPLCGGDDRFVVFVEGNSWCRVCKHKRWWDRPDDVKTRIAEELAVRREEQERLRTTMAGCEDWKGYHDTLLGNHEYLRLWECDGITLPDIEYWGLGFCISCPLAGRPSLTIPVFANGRLVDIRHRLVDGKQGDKYRSHVAGLPPSPFNLDSRHAATHVVVVEGEKKAMHLVRAGYVATIGLPGVQTYAELVSNLADLTPGQDVALMLDPGTDEVAREIADAILPLGHAVYIADAFGKPDDLLLEHGREVLDVILSQARRYGPGRAALARWSLALS